MAGRACARLPIAATAAVDPIGFAMPIAAGANAAGEVADETGAPSGAAVPPVDAATLDAFESPPDGVVAEAGFAATVVAGVAGMGACVFMAPLPGIARLAAFGMPLGAGAGLAAFGAPLAGVAMPAVFAGSLADAMVPAVFAKPAVDEPVSAAFATPAAIAPAATAADDAPRDCVPGLSQPAGAVGSTAARAAPPAGALRRSPRCASFGFQSVGRA
ncbi:hypothetical protein NX868_29185 [Burkholderia thailandensis]|nr:hypothetical protein [Burkholderia thailandensis]MCS6486341.1 hypothetical protein [Burkholderia thailandensis]